MTPHPTPRPSAEELLTVAEVAAIVRLTEEEVRVRLRRRELRGYKPTGRKSWLVPRSAVDTYLTGEPVAV